MTALAKTQLRISIRGAAGIPCESGEVHVNISSDPPYTQFEILDNGHGIHLEPGEDLLSPFFTKKHDGTGLGLSIVQRIVASQGGAIRYANREEGGARFEVRVPTDQGDFE